jgi:DNA topoisomerase I
LNRYVKGDRSDMASKLLIVESPGKIKKLSQILESDWLVKASVGFDLEGNSVQCRFMARGSRGAEIIQGLKAAVKQVQTIVLATDPDREGETIAWHLQQALSLNNPQQVVYTEITPNAVRAAIAHPRRLDLNLVHSGLCRTVLDKLIGYKGSPLLWLIAEWGKVTGET